MRVLLDECVNQRLRNYLPGHECESAEYAGFAGLKNGELLDAAESAHFDVLLTVDRGLEYEQNLAGRRIAIIIRCPDPEIIAVRVDDKSGGVVRQFVVPDMKRISFCLAQALRFGITG